MAGDTGGGDGIFSRRTRDGAIIGVFVLVVVGFVLSHQSSNSEKWRNLTDLVTEVKVGNEFLIKQVDELKEGLDGIREEQAGIREEQAGIREEQAGIRQNQGGILEALDGIREEQAGFRQNQGGILEALGGIRENQGGILATLDGNREIQDLTRQNLSRRIDTNAERLDKLESRLDEGDGRLDILEDDVRELTGRLSPGEDPAGQVNRTILRIGTRHAPESGPGRSIRLYSGEVARMSGGGISIEVVFQPSAEGSVEDIPSGMPDCDMSGGPQLVGGNPVFQSARDVMAGHRTPHERMSWLHLDGGLEHPREACADNGLHLVGFWGHEQTIPWASFQSKSTSDFEESGLDSKSGGGNEILDNLVEQLAAKNSRGEDSAGEWFTVGPAGSGNPRLHGIIGGADFPGFHSMSSNHLVCDEDVWDAMPERHRAIMTTAMKALSLHTALMVERRNAEAAAWVRARGADPEWFPAGWLDFIDSFRIWSEFAVTPESAAIVADHVEYLARIGSLTR